MKLSDFKNLSSEDIRKMKAPDLIRYIRGGSEIANKKRKEMLNFLEENPSLPKPQVFRSNKSKGYVDYESYNFNLGRINYDKVSGKMLNTNVNQLRHKLNVITTFLNSKTLGKKQWKKHLNEFKDRVINKIQPRAKGKFTRKMELTDANFDMFWRAYNEVANDDATKAIVSSYDSNQFQRLLYETMSEVGSGDFETIVRTMTDKLTKAYEDKQSVKRTTTKNLLNRTKI